MFWPYIRLLRSLSALQHFVVFIPTFAIPIFFEVERGWQDTGFCMSCVDWGKLALYFGWYQIALLVIALATRRDRVRAEERLDRVYCELNSHIAKISEEHQRQMTGIEDRVGDLREWVRNIDNAMRDQLGADLPARAVSIRAVGSLGAATGSAALSVSGSAEWRARLSRWLRRQARNLRRWAHRIFVDWEES